MKIKKCRAEIEHCGFSSYFKDLLPTSVSKKSRALVRSPGIDMMAARKLSLFHFTRTSAAAAIPLFCFTTCFSVLIVLNFLRDLQDSYL